MANNPEQNEGNELLLEEFRQAWLHYRHLENIRSWYVGAFLAITAIVFGNILSLRLTPGELDENFYLISSPLVSFIAVFSLVVNASLLNNRMGLHHYRRALSYVRKRIYEEKYCEISKEVETAVDPAVKATRGLSVEAMFPWLVWLIFFAGEIYLFLAAFCSCYQGKAVGPAAFLLGVAAPVLLGVAAVCVFYRQCAAHKEDEMENEKMRKFLCKLNENIST